jgi:hypothetical protein
MMGSDCDADLRERVIQAMCDLFRQHPVDRDTAIFFFNFFVGLHRGLTGLDESVNIALDETRIAFSWLLKNNMAYFDVSHVIPIWVEFDDDEIVFSLLADFMEVAHPCWADPDFLFETLDRIMSHDVLGYSSDETRTRLIRILTQIAQSPETGAVFQMMADQGSPFLAAFMEHMKPS